MSWSKMKYKRRKCDTMSCIMFQHVIQVIAMEKEEDRLKFVIEVVEESKKILQDQ